MIDSTAALLVIASAEVAWALLYLAFTRLQIRGDRPW